MLDPISSITFKHNHLISGNTLIV